MSQDFLGQAGLDGKFLLVIRGDIFDHDDIFTQFEIFTRDFIVAPTPVVLLGT